MFPRINLQIQKTSLHVIAIETHWMAKILSSLKDFCSKLLYLIVSLNLVMSILI